MRPSLIIPSLALITGTLGLYIPELDDESPCLPGAFTDDVTLTMQSNRPSPGDIKSKAPKGVDLQYAKCYRITNSDDQKLGLFNNRYYQWGGREGRRIFKVCRYASGNRGGHCKADNDDQTVRDHRPFYLLDAQGSDISNGQAWMAASDWMYPLPSGWSPTLISELVGERNCDQDEDGNDTDCFVRVKQKNSPFHRNGLADVNHNGLLYTTFNSEQTIHMKFHRVQCPEHVVSEDELDEAEHMDL
ncbi:hypothetical protein BJX96DRAFT_180988 [Aspergillus floccosus]